MNKTFLVIFAVAVCAVVAVPASSANKKDDKIINIISYELNSFKDEICFYYAIEITLEANPDLDELLQSAVKARKIYLVKVEKCGELPDSGKIA